MQLRDLLFRLVAFALVFDGYLLLAEGKRVLALLESADPLLELECLSFNDELLLSSGPASLLCEPFAFRRQLPLSGLECRGTFARRPFELRLAPGECAIRLFDLELACTQRRLSLGYVALARYEGDEPLLELGLAPCEQLLRVRLVGIALRVGAAQSQAAALLSTRSHLVELLRTPLDLELAAGDIGCAFAKRTLQIFDLRESFRALPLVCLSETARESQDLVTVGIFLRLRRCRVPAVRLP